mgnify:CR=1 FL=1
MFELLRRLFGKEEISEKTVRHSSKGDYTPGGRLKGGGHGQEALDYMDKNGIQYNITKTYPNGVRVGNVPKHEQKRKRTGNNQSWFPRDWDRPTIKKAGQSVAKGKKLPDGKIKTARHKGVDVGIIRTGGKIATIFPMSEQKSNRSKKK